MEQTPLRFGLLLSPQHLAGEPIDARLREHLQQVRLIEQLGFHSVWDGQHYLSDYQELQTIPLLAWLAAHTSRLRLGTGILILPLYHPVGLAEDLATLDILSGGRLIAGFGLGYRKVEFQAFGIPQRSAPGRLREGIEIIRRLWTEASVTYEGRYFSLSETSINPRPLQRPRPPIWIAANADVAVRRAALLGDAWLINPHATVPHLERQLALFREEWRLHQRTFVPELPLMRELHVAKSRTAALNESRPYLERKYRKYLAWGQQTAMEPGDPIDLPYKRLAADRFLLGDPMLIRDEIARYRATLGVTEFIFRVQWPGLPNEVAMQSLRLFGEEVLPRLS